MTQHNVTWCCRYHPTDWFHEVGCPHMEWTKEQLLDALVTAKHNQQVVHKKFIESMTGLGSVTSQAGSLTWPASGTNTTVIL
jgi:ABC-type ATPase with predicted acetyltransferase domain